MLGDLKLISPKSTPSHRWVKKVKSRDICQRQKWSREEKPIDSQSLPWEIKLPAVQPENSGATLATGTFSPPQCEQTKSPREQSLIWERGRRGAVEGGGMQQRSTPAWESSQGCIEKRCKENIHLADKYNSANQAFQFEWEPLTFGLHWNFPSSWATRVCTVWHKGRGRFSFWFWVKRARLPGETARHRHQILNFLPLSRCLAGFGQIHQIWKQFHIEKKRTP